MKRGDIIAGKYLVEHTLGEGGMGVVLAVRHIELSAPMAIKVPEPRGPADDRLLHEARLTVRLTSDHVVRVYDAGRSESGVPYMVLERLEGHDLHDLLERGGRVPSEEAALYVSQACLALEEAHALGVVHLDIKPANLFLTVRRDGSPCLKIIDFGIARSNDAPWPEAKRGIQGSPAYMAPEQLALGSPVDARSDLWSLGVVLYELSTGQAPFSADNLAEMIWQVQGVDPVPAGSLRPDLPPALAAVIARCLSKNPARRFQTAAELRRALAPFAAGGPAARWSTPEGRGRRGARERGPGDRYAETREITGTRPGWSTTLRISSVRTATLSAPMSDLA